MKTSLGSSLGHEGMRERKSARAMEFFLNVFTEFVEFSDQKHLLLKGFEPATSCVKDQDTIKVPAKHM